MSAVKQTTVTESRILQFVHRNIEEISTDRALVLYGGILALLHVLAFLHWEFVHPLRKILDPGHEAAVCWPFFENCQAWRVLSPALVEIILRIYLVFAIWTAFLFFKKKNIFSAWIALLLLNAFKALIIFQDYRLVLNQHYMTFWVTLAYLFLPDKRQVLRYLIAGFYFWAGTLKFTPEWISGAALYGKKPLGIPESLIPASCVYVIILELVIVLGVFARNRWLFWGSFLQLVLFHIASWPIVNFFYPTLMLSILSIYPLARYIGDPLRPENDPPLSVDLRKFFRGQEGLGTYVLVGLFAFFQFVPFAFPGNQSITGEGRMFALHMFDAPLECNAWATLRSKQGQQDIAMQSSYLPPRISCDPAVYFSLAKDLCRRANLQRDFGSVELHLEVRRSSQKEFTTLIDQRDFCAKDLHYDLWKHNSWILTPRENKQ